MLGLLLFLSLCFATGLAVILLSTREGRALIRQGIGCLLACIAITALGAAVLSMLLVVALLLLSGPVSADDAVSGDAVPVCAGRCGTGPAERMARTGRSRYASAMNRDVEQRIAARLPRITTRICLRSAKLEEPDAGRRPFTRTGGGGIDRRAVVPGTGDQSALDAGLGPVGARP